MVSLVIDQEYSVQENEVLTFFLGVAILTFMISNRKKIREIWNYKILLYGTAVMMLKSIFTILEGFFLGMLFNFLEHLMLALFSFLILYWLITLIKRKDGEVVQDE
ncbi:MAG: hypothetical protein ACTSYS_05725 [Promethearchaeota archaeon]